VAKPLRVFNRTRNVMLIERGVVAASLWARLRGLLGHAPLRSGEGLLLCGEKAIHTIGMGFPIDVLFLDRNGRVVHLIPKMVPLRLSPFVPRAVNVLELPAETIKRTSTALGDEIILDF